MRSRDRLGDNIVQVDEGAASVEQYEAHQRQMKGKAGRGSRKDAAVGID